MRTPPAIFMHCVLVSFDDTQAKYSVFTQPLEVVCSNVYLNAWLECSAVIRLSLFCILPAS